MIIFKYGQPGASTRVAAQTIPHLSNDELVANARKAVSVLETFGVSSTSGKQAGHHLTRIGRELEKRNK